MHERGEPHIPAFAGYFTYAAQPHRRAGPTLCPGRGGIYGVPLGCPPFLPILRWRRCEPVAVVRIVLRYYAGIRLLVSSDIGLVAFGLPRDSWRAGVRRDLPVSVRRISPHAQGLRPLGTLGRLAISAIFGFAHRITASAPQTFRFRGSMAGLRFPLSTLRRRPHGRPRMTRGQNGSLLLSRVELSSTSFTSFTGALFIRGRPPFESVRRVRHCDVSLRRRPSRDQC